MVRRNLFSWCVENWSIFRPRHGIFFFPYNFSTVFDLVSVRIPINYSGFLEKLRAIIECVILLLQPQTSTRTWRWSFKTSSQRRWQWRGLILAGNRTSSCKYLHPDLPGSNFTIWHECLRSWITTFYIYKVVQIWPGLICV